MRIGILHGAVGIKMPNKRKTKAEELLDERLGPVEAAIDAIKDQLTSLTKALAAPIKSPPAVDEEESDEADKYIRIQGIPKPENLEEQYSLAQFQDWRRRYLNYLKAQGAQSAPVKQGNAILSTFLGQEISDVLRLVLEIPPESDYVSVLDRLEGYYRGKENGRIRRSQFTNRKQEEGENFMSFYREKMKLFHVSDPCQHCYERSLIDNIIESLRDEHTRRKCRALPDSSSLSDLVKLCEAEEMANREERSHSGEGISRVLQPQRKNRQCPRCNNPWHASLKDCPAIDKECSSCKKRGHFPNTRFCRFKKTIREISDEVTISYTKVNGVSSRQDNRFEIVVTAPLNQRSLRCLAIPDTGAEVCVAGTKLLRDLSVDPRRLRRTNLSLTTADNTKMEVLGKLQTIISYGDCHADVEIFVCKGVRELLIDRATLVSLRVIHRDFPRQISSIMAVNHDYDIPENPSTEEIERIKERLIAEYEDVFDTKPLKPMKGKKVHIELKEGAIPCSIRCPRKIPFAWRDQVKQELDDLVAKNIIKPAPEEASDFVSPLVVVPKPNGKLRVCVDFTKLNKFVKRPVHPFKAPWEAVSDISNGNKYFTCMDAASGYFQLELDEPSQKLTTFMTPWGRFQFLRAPMGLVSSGDEFCRRGDEALSGIQNLQKVVDDILAYDENFRAHVSRVKEILDRCRTYAITLNKQKFVFAKSEIPYVGYIVSSSGIKANPEKVEAVTKFREPKNITELRSFLGMVNQLGNFSPDISGAATPLRELLSTKNEFLWSHTHTDAFGKVKAMLTEPPILTHFELTRNTALHVDASRTNGLDMSCFRSTMGYGSLSNAALDSYPKRRNDTR